MILKVSLSSACVWLSRLRFNTVIDIRNEKTFLSSSSRASSPFESQLRTSCREFHPRRQLWELLSAGFKRWVVTLALVACLYGTLYDFDKKAVMSKQKKKVFNAMVTGLSIALGLNIQRSLKALAGEMRWWILSRHPRPLHEVGCCSEALLGTLD